MFCMFSLLTKDPKNILSYFKHDMTQHILFNGRKLIYNKLIPYHINEYSVYLVLNMHIHVYAGFHITNPLNIQTAH